MKIDLRGHTWQKRFARLWFRR